MLTGTLVTAAGFLPVGFANSSTGEYAGGIFWVVGLALIASWFVAVLFTPYLGARSSCRTLPKRGGAACAHDPDAIYDTRIYRALRRVIEFCLRWRKTVVAATVLMFVGVDRGLRPGAAAVLPDLDPHRAVLRDAAAGGHRDRRDRRRPRRRRRAARSATPTSSTYTTYVGQGAPRFWLGLNPVLPNPNFAQIVIVTKDLEARERVKARLEKALADGALPEARTRVDRFVFGPPVGYPGAVPRHRARPDEGARHRRGRPQGDGGRTASSSIRISTGASRSSRSASRSTRTAPAPSASPRRMSRRRCRRCCPASP